jgi:outer membrane protein assembly factor BamB
MTAMRPTVLTLALIASCIPGVASAGTGRPGPDAGARETAPPPAAQLHAELHAGKLTLERALTLQHHAVTSVNAEKLLSGVPLSAGDLDGDGKQDVIVYRPPQATEKGEPTEGRIEGYRGLDGVQLWSRRIGGFWSFAVAELSGDGVSEVVLLTLVPGPKDSSSYSLQRTITVLRGRDLAPVWSVSGEEHADGRFASTNLAQAVVHAVRGAMVSFGTMPDADGDGGDELFLATLDEARATAWGVLPDGDVTQHTNLSQVTATVLRGADGEPIGQGTATSIRTGPCAEPESRCVSGDDFLVPVIAASPDMSGDGLADLIALSYDELGGHLRSLPAAGGDEHWSAPFPTESAYLSGVELTGDGRADPMAYLWHHSGDLLAYDGAGGQRLWVRAASGSISYQAGDIDGDGGTDFIEPHLPGWRRRPPPGLVFAWSGATGRDIWAKAYTYEPPAGTVAALFESLWIDDLDGDGKRDLLVVRLAFGESDELLDFTELALEGRDGTVLWTTQQMREFYETPSPVFGDVDANGTRDLFVEREENGVRLVETVDGATLRPLWNAPLPDAGGPSILSSATFAADVGGDVLPEIVFDRFTSAGRWAGAAAPGRVLWTLETSEVNP